MNFIDLNSLAEEILEEFLDEDICNFYYIPKYAPKVVFVDDLSVSGMLNITKIKNKPVVLIEINETLCEIEIRKTLIHELLHYVLYLNDADWSDNGCDFNYWAELFDVI